jgi:hypothetical protein
VATGFRMGSPPSEMKTETRSAKSRTNGAPLSRKELLQAHERALKRVQKMTAQEGFDSLVRAGIYTRDGKLTPRYGG